MGHELSQHLRPQAVLLMLPPSRSAARTARMAEAVRIIKAIVSGEARELGRFDGEFHQLDLSGFSSARPLRPDLPVWVAALREPLVPPVAGNEPQGQEQRIGEVFCP